MSSGGLSELVSFSPKKIPPFTHVKSGFKHSALETDSNGKHHIRIFLYDAALTDVSELRVVMTPELYAAHESNLSNYLIAKLGLRAAYIEPVHRDMDEVPAPTPVAEETPSPVHRDMDEVPASTPAADETPTPAPVSNPVPRYFYLMLDESNRMVFPQGFSRNASMEIVDADGEAILFALMKMDENNVPVISNKLDTNADNIPILPSGCSKSTEGHILTADGSAVVITYNQYLTHL